MIINVKMMLQRAREELMVGFGEGEAVVVSVKFLKMVELLKDPM